MRPILVMEDFVASLLPNRLKYCVVYIQRASKLSLSYKTTWIQKKSYHHICQIEITHSTPSICNHRVTDNLR